MNGKANIVGLHELYRIIVSPLITNFATIIPIEFWMRIKENKGKRCKHNSVLEAGQGRPSEIFVVKVPEHGERQHF